MTIRYFFVGSSFLRIPRLEHPIGSHRLGEFLVVFLGFSQNSSENLQEIHGIQWNHPESHEEIHGSPGVLSGFPPSVLNVERGTAPSEPPVPSSGGLLRLTPRRWNTVETVEPKTQFVSKAMGEPAGYLTVCQVLVQKQKNPKV
jgi:hypothetical protein